jgi:DNA polymerase-3 subunit alpha
MNKHGEIVGFESIHAHSTFSTLDGHSMPEDMAKRWKNYGKYLSISDHGMMAVIPRQIRACEKNNLTPIFASELYINPMQIEFNSDDDRSKYLKTLSPEEQKKFRKSCHLLAIAHNDLGYSNLVTLSSLAWTKGFYYRPRINHEQLMQYKEGITFSSCCYLSEVGQAFDAGGEEAGYAMIEKYMAMLGENYYLEFMLLDFAKQKPYNVFILKAHDKYKLPLIVTLDAHYVNKEDSKYQRRMLMMQTKRTIKDIERIIQEQGGQDLFELQDENLWLKSEEELNEKWYNDYRDTVDYDLFKQAKMNTVEICRKAGNVKLDRSIKLPIIDNANERLKELALQGFKRLNLPKTREYQSRLAEELSLIFRKNFSSYFLIAKEAVDEGKRFYHALTGSYNASGPGRGSGVGSLVCYCLGTTKINPVKQGLLFSRFLSEARNDMPDLDLDFEERTANHLKKTWVVNRFGRDYTALIGTYNTFGIKNSLLDSARIFRDDNDPDATQKKNEIQAITKKIATKDEDGKELTWDKAVDTYSELKKYVTENEDIADTAKNLLHRIKNMGTHAGGVLISSKPINKFVPLVRTKDGDFVSAWTEGLHEQELGPMGFVKYDFLVITNLQQIDYICNLVKKRHGVRSLWSIDGQEDFNDDKFLEDEKAIAMANEADLIGIFQFDSEGIRNMVRKGGVSSFGDLASYTAIYRPATLEMGVDDSYINRKKGNEQYELHSLLQPILGDTHGLMIYQEQVAKVLHVVGDIPLKDCETLRKAISKKKEEIFRPYKEQFLINGQKNLGWSEEQVSKLWDEAAAFSGYGFNKSHACAYTYISFIQLYLKAHYPLEFFAGLLHYETVGETIKFYKRDAERHDVKLRELTVNKSLMKCDLVDDELYFGWSHIKGIGETQAEKIIANYPYDSFSEFLAKYGTDESIIKAVIGLRLFKKDARFDKLYKYYKWYKDAKEKLQARDKRHVDIIKRYNDEIEVIKNDTSLAEEERAGKVAEIEKKIASSEAKYIQRPTLEDKMPTLENWYILPDQKEPALDPKMLKLYNSPEECENQFYGFIWNHPLRKSPDYEGKRTFDDFKVKGAEIDYVEVLIKEVTKQISKKKTEYWLIKAEDANGEESLIQVWQEDWNRFSSELKAGELFKLKLKAPDKGFNRYTLFSPPKWQKWEREKVIPKDRRFDVRVVPLKKSELVE